MRKRLHQTSIIAAIALAWTAPAHAGAGVVGQPALACSRTIQQAIDGAPANGTVLVEPGSYTEDLTISKNITIKVAAGGTACQGESTTARATLSPLDATNGIGLIVVDPGKNLTLHNFDLRDGVSNDAGGILLAVQGSIITIHNSTFKGGAAPWGAAIALGNDALTPPGVAELYLYDTSFDDNHTVPPGGPGVQVGGAIFVQADHKVYMYGSSMGLTASNTAADDGGAVWLESPTSELHLDSGSRIRYGEAGGSGGCVGGDGKVVVNGGTMDHCEAGVDGGAIQADTVQLTGSAWIHRNTSGRDGGAVFANTLHMLGGRLNLNTAARDGGSVRADSVGLSYSASIESSDAGRNGGCVYGGSVSMQHGSTVMGCEADQHGGAIRAASLGMSGSSAITDGAAGGSGGLVYVPRFGSLNMSDSSSLSEGQATTGGLVSLGLDTTATLQDDATLQDGVASTHGGLISQTGGILTIEGAASLSDGEAGTDGGLIHKAAGTTTLKDDASLSYGLATGRGGLMFLGDDTSTTVGGALWVGAVVLSHGTAGGNGGGIFVEGSESTLTLQGEATVRSSSANHGGGIAVNAAEIGLRDLVVIGGENSGNVAASQGGGIALANGATGTVLGYALDFKLGSDAPDDGVRIVENFGTLGGGGIYATGGSSLTANNLVVLANDATGASAGGGGLAVVDGASVTLRRVSVHGNNARRGGGAFVHEGSLFVDSEAVAEPCAGYEFHRYCAEFRDNEARGAGSVANEGGAVFVADGAVDLDRLALIHNRANDGSGIAGRDESSVVLRSVLVHSNIASSTVHSASIQGTSTMDAYYSTFAGDGTTVSFGSLTSGLMVANIIWPDAPNGAGVSLTAGASVTGGCNVGLGVGALGGGNVASDPLFVIDPARGPYRLDDLSPARDLCGTPSSLVDLDGHTRTPRPLDAGAFIWRDLTP